MPNDLCNSPATFKRLVHIVFREEMNEQVLIFLNDITLNSSTIEEHFESLEFMFQRLASHGLKIKPSNSFTEIGFLLRPYNIYRRDFGRCGESGCN